MKIHLLFANISWYLLIGILYIRPLAEIFRWKPFFVILRYRRQLGILCGVSALFHATLYLWGTDALSLYFFDSFFWKLNTLFGWGSFALVAMLFPLMTSNTLSQKFFKRRWKSIQRFSYAAFILAGIHISFVRGEIYSSIVPIFLWAVLLFWAWRKKR